MLLDISLPLKKFFEIVHLVAGHVGQDWSEGPVAVGVRPWSVTFAEAVRAMPEKPTPPAVHLDFVWISKNGNNNEYSRDSFNSGFG